MQVLGGTNVGFFYFQTATKVNVPESRTVFQNLVSTDVNESAVVSQLRELLISRFVATLFSLPQDPVAVGFEPLHLEHKMFCSGTLIYLIIQSGG